MLRTHISFTEKLFARFRDLDKLKVLKNFDVNLTIGCTLKEDQPLRLPLNLFFYRFNRSESTYKSQRIKLLDIITVSIAEKCFDIWGILKMASVKSVESGNNCFSVNHIIRCRSKFLPLGFSKFALVLIL